MKLSEKLTEINDERIREESTTNAEAGLRGSWGQLEHRSAAAALDPRGKWVNVSSQVSKLRLLKDSRNSIYV